MRDKMTGASSRRWIVALVALLGSQGVAAQTASDASRTRPTAACAVVSASWASQIAATPSATPTVPAKIAYECLNSVPLGKEAAIKLVEAIEPYLEWQTDSAYKADPPSDYFYPPYDMFAALDKVKANLKADKYANEFQFQEDLYVTVFGPGHDGHFVFYPDALTKVFEWRRQRSLVSISEDGTSLPVIKLYEDVISSPDTASVVTLINGKDAATYIGETIYKATYNQDADAAYNSMFYAKASVAASNSKGYFSGGGRIRYIYQGPNTTFTFQNSSTLTLENMAAVKANMSGVVDGESFYKKFCSAGTSSSADAVASIAAEEAAAVIGYPSPVVTTGDGVVSGYYLEGEGFEDVAVIALLAFESESISEFQSAAQTFFADAVAAGKKKLVIDVQGNGGGYILLGYDFFRQLFPQVLQDGYSRWRENDGFMAMSEIVSARVAGLDPYTSSDPDLISDYESWFNYRFDLNLTNQPFETFEDKFTPHVYQNTPYTSIMRWNLNDNLTTTNDTFGLGIEVTGYGTLSNETQPFLPENIILLYDGICASTCTLASEMLRIQGGVKSVAFGGRPQAGPIQGVGGIKGAQVLDWNSIYSYASFYSTYATDANQTAALARYSQLPVLRSSAAAVNVRDQILRDNVDDGLPAQYVVEEADCRLWWTLPMISDVTEVWKAAANAAWNGGKCVGGAGFSGTASEKRAETAVAAGKKDVVSGAGKAVPRQLVKKETKVITEQFKAAFLQKAIP